MWIAQINVRPNDAQNLAQKPRHSSKRVYHVGLKTVPKWGVRCVSHTNWQLCSLLFFYKSIDDDRRRCERVCVSVSQHRNFSIFKRKECLWSEINVTLRAIDSAFQLALMESTGKWMEASERISKCLLSIVWNWNVYWYSDCIWHHHQQKSILTCTCKM